MSQKSIVLIVVLFILLIIGMFTFAHLKRVEIINDVATTTPQTNAEEIPYAYINQIDAKHYFIDGKHTLVGEIEMPTPCDLIEATAVVAESFPEQVTIDFNVVNNADVCADVITPYRFRVDFSASDEAVIKGRLVRNSLVSNEYYVRDIILNLIPASPDEKPEDFEVFIKG